MFLTYDFMCKDIIDETMAFYSNVWHLESRCLCYLPMPGHNTCRNNNYYFQWILKSLDTPQKGSVACDTSSRDFRTKIQPDAPEESYSSSHNIMQFLQKYISHSNNGGTSTRLFHWIWVSVKHFFVKGSLKLGRPRKGRKKWLLMLLKV